MEKVEDLINATMSLISPAVCAIADRAMDQIKNDPLVGQHLDFTVQYWPSRFTGISALSNRVMPFHRDKGGLWSIYDLLLSSGTHTGEWLDVPDINVRFQYMPGTVVALCGKVLQHGVSDWIQGDRVCFVHFLKETVLQKLCKSQLIDLVGTMPNIHDAMYQRRPQSVQSSSM